jgi:hypothetical protein
LSTVARGQRLSWWLREDHHGTEHGGRHLREFGFTASFLYSKHEGSHGVIMGTRKKQLSTNTCL